MCGTKFSAGHDRKGGDEQHFMLECSAAKILSYPVVPPTLSVRCRSVIPPFQMTRSRTQHETAAKTWDFCQEQSKIISQSACPHHGHSSTGAIEYASVAASICDGNTERDREAYHCHT
eukprot:6191600-Pleurochrysis_carterae.AAC.2